MTINIRNQEVILSKERAIYLPKEKILAISDLHLGKSAYFRKAGVQVPSTIAQTDLRRLSLVLDEHKPSTLLINGDMFHHELNSDVDEFEKWKQNYNDVNFVLVKGNHDRLQNRHYQDLKIDVRELTFCTDEFCFIHDSTHCRSNELYPMSGHIHPGVSLIGPGKQRLKFPCFYFGVEYAVLPAFSTFTGLYTLKPKLGDQIYAITPSKVVKV
ncbi:MAG: ligase-associated DNA damage response endonuclease PdeM [Pedobacter sp.]|nr:MAG: ligase-associated DNA damage response endonuclease PdeM [Pedobacter sp.]